MLVSFFRREGQPFWMRGVCPSTLVLVVLCLSALMGCRKKKIATTNLPGNVAVLKPYTEEEKRVRDVLPLVLKLYDTEKVQAFDVIVNGKTVWRKALPAPGSEDVTIKTELKLSDIPGLKDGRQTLVFRLRDQKGQDSFSKLQVFVDRTGPAIDWTEPSPQSRLLRVSRAELEVKDRSGVKKVEVFHENKLVRRMLYPPYAFRLDPSDFSSGIVNFRVEAVDGLGNQSRKMFAFVFTGSSEGTPCAQANSCKPPFLCVKKVGEARGVCRQPCRLRSDCARGFLCRKAGKARVCLPDSRGKRKRIQRKTAGLMESCSARVVCRRGMRCIALATGISRCLAECGVGKPPCPAKKFKCTKLPRSAQRVCLPLKKGPKRRDVGQTCSTNQPCVKTAVCIRAPGQAVSRCYKKCQSKAQCSSRLICQKLSGKSYGICMYMPYQTVGAYQLCSPKRKCRYGYQCISTRSNPKPRCFPACKNGCPAGSVCAKAGANSVCLQRCNPKSPSCPGNTTCGMTFYGKKSAHLCR